MTRNGSYKKQIRHGAEGQNFSRFDQSRRDRLFFSPLFTSHAPASDNLTHAMPSTSKKSPNFESALAELEAIVESMEAGKLPLDEALSSYQRGVELVRQCGDTLQAAEQKIAVIEASGQRPLGPNELRSPSAGVGDRGQ
jgi:exodeoxyribonuclease VII small subunit